MATVDGKWFPQVTGNLAALDAAQTILRARTASLREALWAAMSSRGERCEDVHRLRVSARRLAAALSTFEDLNAKPFRRAAKACAKVRRAAGGVRDADVLIATLEPRLAKCDLMPEELVKRVRKSLADRRTKTVSKFAARIDKCYRLFDRRILPLLDEPLTPIANCQETTWSYGSLAKVAVRKDAAELLSYTAEKLRRIDSIHGLRIAGKRFRYGLELFMSCFSPEIAASLYDGITEVQERLGTINDLCNLYATLANHREAVARESGSKVRRDVCRHFDYLTAAIAHEWLERQRVFVADWLTVRRSAMEKEFHRLFGDDMPAVCVDVGTTNGGGMVSTHGDGSHMQNEPQKHVFGANSNGPRGSAPLAPAAESHSEGRRIEPQPRGLDDSGPIRLGAIDVGSNSIRLVVAEAADNGTYRVIDEEREMTRLAADLERTGRLNADAIERSLAVIGKMKAIAEGFQVHELRAIATSAARDAANGDVLCREAQNRFGLHVEVISPGDEARLAVQSAVRHFKLNDALTAIVDIGGGSVEVVLAADALVERILSFPLGAVRVSEAFKLTGPIAPRHWSRLRKHLDRVIRDAIGKPPFNPELMVGTGGTFTTLAEIVRSHREGRADSVHGYMMTLAEVEQLVGQLGDMSLEQRRQLHGLNPSRADIIVGGGAVIVRLAKHLGVEQITVNDRGIRDGLLLTMMAERGAPKSPPPVQTTDRIDWARRFAGRCRSDEAHCEHVARLASQIFDQLQPVHDLPSEGRDVLRAAALLHDVGYLINHAQHHKHAYHLIMHGELPGFSMREIELIANVARYHRRATPKKSHANFERLDGNDRQLVRKLAGILRVADGLDRTHTAKVRRIGCEDGGLRIRFTSYSTTDPHVEIWYAEGKADLLKRALHRDVEFSWNQLEATDMQPSAPAHREPEPAVGV